MKQYERIDDLQLGGLKIIQDTRGFCFGIDAVLLADFAKDAISQNTLDLCSGNGIVAILLAGKTATPHIHALEIQAGATKLAKRSIELNGLSDRITAVCADARNAPKIFKGNSFDVITCNPPYMPLRDGLHNISDSKAIARHEIACTLEDIISVSSQLLRIKGKLFLVHRPSRLVDIISLMRRYKIEPKRIRMVHPSPDKNANIVLIEGVRHGGCELIMMPPLFVHDKNGGYSDEINRIYGRAGESNG